MKKKYEKPNMKVVKLEKTSPLLAASGEDNPWWKDEQPSADEWWGR